MDPLDIPAFLDRRGETVKKSAYRERTQRYKMPPVASGYTSLTSMASAVACLSSSLSSWCGGQGND